VEVDVIGTVDSGCHAVDKMSCYRDQSHNHTITTKRTANKQKKINM
jgi:hypothetical protein